MWFDGIYKIDIYVGLTKIGSVIGSQEYIHSIFPKWARMRYAKGLPMGCSNQYRIDK